MTDLTKARMLIQDQDPTDQIFTDDEINLILEEERKYKAVEANPVTLDYTYFALKEVLSKDPQEVKVLNDSAEEIPGTVSLEFSTVSFDSDPNCRVYVQGKFINWNAVHGRMLITIATNVRKWNSYSVGGLSEQYNKEELLRFGRSLLPATGMW